MRFGRVATCLAVGEDGRARLEYQQIVQCVKSVGAAESWDTSKADKHVKEAVHLATEIELRRKDAAASDQFREQHRVRDL